MKSEPRWFQPDLGLSNDWSYFGYRQDERRRPCGGDSKPSLRANLVAFVSAGPCLSPTEWTLG